MKRIYHLISILPMMLAACQSSVDRETIARLRNVQIEIKEEQLEGGLEKAMQGYERFLKESPDSALAPEAIRRLADLKIEKEYGTLTTSPPSSMGQGSTNRMTPPPPVSSPSPLAAKSPQLSSPSPLTWESPQISSPSPLTGEGRGGGDQRAPGREPLPEVTVGAERPAEAANDLERASAREAIELYKKLLQQYPFYERNDQVLYQMSRAYEELGQTIEAMQIMERMVREYPGSRYLDEVQFRRAEYFFAHKRYLDAEDAYASIVKIGSGSYFYDLALYKMGWTFYKQELYEEALNRFILLLDYKVSIGYDFAQTQDEQERKRMEDTFRVISLSFSNLGGPDSVAAYFNRRGARSYEDGVYSNLGEFYFDKRRYADAAAAYSVFIKGNPFHKAAPNFQMRVIEIHAAGGFPSLVLDAKKKFASTYGLKADYWNHFDPETRPEVLGYLKTNLTDLASHYHACYQDPEQAEAKSQNFKEALRWYREFLASFPSGSESPSVNFQLAGLLFENRLYSAAAEEYEKTAYDYPLHEKSSQAGYAAVYAHRQHLAEVDSKERDRVKREAVRSSLKFADTFPEHEKAAIVLGAAADDLYLMKEYEQALYAAGKLLAVFPAAESEVRRSAFLVVAHSSYELQRYGEAEGAYANVLAMLPAEDPSRGGLIDNLAASIYKQGEQSVAAKDYRAAAEHFLRVGRLAPTSGIRPTAEFDAAAALIQLKQWQAAAAVLTAFRATFPGHALQPEVTKKMALVYREDGKLSLAASEFERIEKESSDDDIRRDALLVAADLHEQAGDKARALAVYRRYVGFFHQPVELNLETRNKIAEILKESGDRQAYLEELRQIVAIDASAGSARSARTLYLASQAGLVLAVPGYEEFTAVALVEPFEVNLRKKRDLMKAATQAFGQLLEYNVGEVTAAANFHLAEIYAHFSKALTTSERPKGLSPLEMEQYELAIEEQAYPFEEKAIAVHESNLKLIQKGVYNPWVEKSLQKLAVFMPARYDKPEENSALISSLDSFTFEIIRPAPAAAQQTPPAARKKDLPAADEPGKAGAAETTADSAAPPQAEEPGKAEAAETAADSAEPPQAEEPSAAVQTTPAPQEQPAGQESAAAQAEGTEEP